MKGFGVWSGAVFIGFYAIATVLVVPGSILTIAGGLLFGPWWGALYNLTGATLGATISFLISRYISSGWARRKTGPRLTRIINGIEEEGWRFVAFLRLVPVFPFNITNYALGLTRIPLFQYVFVSFLCMIPGAFAYTYLGAVAQGVLDGDSSIRTLMEKGMMAVGLLAFVLFLPRIVKRFRKTEQYATAEEPSDQ